MHQTFIPRNFPVAVRVFFLCWSASVFLSVHLCLSRLLCRCLYLSPVRSLSVESYTLYPMLFNSNVQGFNPEHIFITRWRETPPPRTLVWSGEAIDWSQRVNICCLATKHRSPCQLMLKSIQFSTERAPIDVSVIEHALFYR